VVLNDRFNCAADKFEELQSLSEKRAVAGVMIEMFDLDKEPATEGEARLRGLVLPVLNDISQEYLKVSD
jgi:hypothetical protein